MKERRTLTLRAEYLSALTTDELRDVNGGATPLCVSEMLAACRTLDWVITLCGYLTEYCSIDVC